MTEASHAADFEPPDCGVCGRSLLVGEAIRLFRNDSGTVRQVCELCNGRAASQGMEAVGRDVARRRVHTTGSVREIAPLEPRRPEADELVSAVQELEARAVEQPDAELVRRLLDQVDSQAREIERLRRDVARERLQEAERTVREQQREMEKLRKRLSAVTRQNARLEYARQAETDPDRMCAHALDAFNGSEHAERMARITRTLGDPVVAVLDQGSALPRRVHVTLSWDIAWYEFCVKLDLGKGKASVNEVGHGGDPRDLQPGQLQPNGRWQTSGLVLA